MYRVEGIKLVDNTNDSNPIGVRTKRRPKKRWRDEERNELKRLKLRNSSQIFKDRKAWNDLVKKMKKKKKEEEKGKKEMEKKKKEKKKEKKKKKKEKKEKEKKEKEKKEKEKEKKKEKKKILSEKRLFTIRQFI